MKNILAIFLLTIFTIAVASCDKDKSNNPSNNNKLIGTWNGEMQYELTYKDGNLAYGDTTKIHSPDYFRLIFKDRHIIEMKSSFSGFTTNESGTYKINGNTVTFSGDELAEAGTYTFKLTENTLELSTSDEKQVNGQTVKEVERIVFSK